MFAVISVGKKDKKIAKNRKETVLPKWISEWSGQRTVKTIVGHHGWPTRKMFEF